MKSINICVLLFLLFKFDPLFSQELYTVESLINISNQIKRNNHYDSIQILDEKDKILSLTKRTNDKNLLFYAYSVLGDINRIEGNDNQAINNYFKALEYAKNSNRLLDIALNYDDLAKIYLNKGKFDLMFESIEKSLAIKEKLNNKVEIFKTKQILSKYYRNKGNYSEVLRIAFNSLSYFISINDSLQIAHTYNRIGVTYYTLENYEKALSYFKLSEVYGINKADKKGLSSLLNNIGIVLLDQKKCQDALENFQRSLEIEKELGNQDDLLIRYHNIGLAYTYLGNYQPALHNLTLCINEFRKSGDLINLASSYEGMAQYHELKGNTDSLEYYLMKSYKLCDSLNIKKLKSKVALQLSLLYQTKNDINKSFKYLKKYKEIDDSIYHSGNTQRIVDEEFNFIRSKDYELQEVEKRNTIKKYIIIIACLVILILVIWIFFLMLNHKVKVSKKINKNLEEKVEDQKDEIITQGKDLVSKTLQLGFNNSEVNYAIQKLNKLKTEFGAQGKQKIQQLIIELEYNQNKDIWSEFELRFSNVNKGFYEKLLSHFPSLTFSEKRLAALILLNFSAKEIATITKQTYRSVLVAKSRLRKKLNIHPSVDLANFLNEFSSS